jgi:hypothetical protein
MNKNPQNPKNPENPQIPQNTQDTQDNLNNTTNLNNIRNEEITIPEIDKKKEFADLDSLLELSKNQSSNSMYEGTEKES